MNPSSATLPREWDVIVIGTGMGGATFGHAMARAGKRVLFLERGRDPTDLDAIRGHYPEDEADAPRGLLGPREADRLARAGRSADDIIDESSWSDAHHTPFIGSGVGGSTALYGMTLTRLPEADFAKGWPVTHTEMQPFYEAAERQYRVHDAREGTSLALPPLSPVGNELFSFFKRRGLAPYRLPLASEAAGGCGRCQNMLCVHGGKNDSRTMCLEPALRDFGATLFDRCQVVRLEADAHRVTSVVCLRNGEPLKLRGATIVLAAGAIHTPSLLLRSTSAAWPEGLANRSGLVGRNLMRHLIDLYLVRPKDSQRPLEGALKELGFDVPGLGTVQSFGSLPSASMLFDSLQHDLGRQVGQRVSRGFSFARRLVQPVLEHVTGRTVALVSMIEDEAQPTNRVQPGAQLNSVRMTYRLSTGDRQRVLRMRALMNETLRPMRYLLVNQAENNERLAHVCGTCRMGDDATTSVLDPTNRAHDVANLYVVDSAFFPTSGSTNPSLTIAANALRVATTLGAHLAPSQWEHR